MENLFYNYIALGEAVMQTIIETYVVCNQRVFTYFDELPYEIIERDKDAIAIIEKRIESNNFLAVYPHAKVSGKELLVAMRKLADENKDNVGTMLFDKVYISKVWNKLDVTEARKDELNLVSCHQSDLLVQDMSDFETMESNQRAVDLFISMIEERIDTLSEFEKQIIVFRFGLCGAPCMSISEIVELTGHELIDVLQTYRNALQLLF